VGVFDGYHGRWAKGADRSFDQLGAGRAANAFHPRPKAGDVRERKRRFTSGVREKLSLRDRVARGEKVSWHDEQSVMWASPKKIAEQRAKTGDALVPRGEITRRERSFHRSLTQRDSRTAVKRTFSGKVLVERGNYRDAAGKRVINAAGKRSQPKHPKKAEYVGRRRAQP
jgi:hypothetical protein